MSDSRVRTTEQEDLEAMIRSLIKNDHTALVLFNSTQELYRQASSLRLLNTEREFVIEAAYKLSHAISSLIDRQADCRVIRLLGQRKEKL